MSGALQHRGPRAEQAQEPSFEDIFTFEIKVDKKVVAKSSFSGNWFQKDVRYEVNIREIIPNIIGEISEYFSRENYTTLYGEYDIKK